jgi:pseudouridylate synthase
MPSPPSGRATAACRRRCAATGPRRSPAAHGARKWALGSGRRPTRRQPDPGGQEIARAEIVAGHRRRAGRGRAQGIAGKEVTPFLLARLEALSGGASLEANVALVLNNARLAAAIAAAYVAL